MKIAVFYLIGQTHDWWLSEFYRPQLDFLDRSGLSDHIDFIDIMVSGGHETLQQIPDRTRRITYYRDPGQEENQALHDIWQWSQSNPGYKVLYFHSIGLSHTQSPDRERKRAWGRFLEFCNIELWQQCVNLLDFYDTVGADYINYASFGVPETRMWAPHYPGFFWWSTSNYIRRLDPGYLQQPVPWQRYLAELWIGTANPRAFMMYRSNINCYVDEIQFDGNAIRAGVDQHLAQLNSNIPRY